MKYQELKTECARLGLSGKGSRQELSGKLDRFLRGDAEQKSFVAEDDNASISPEKVIVENPTKQQGQILADNDTHFGVMAHKADWNKLSTKLDIIFAGRVQYFLQENAPDNYSVVFKGTARRSECINLTAGHKTIEKMAMQFVSRAVIAPKTGGDTPAQAMSKFEATME